MILAGTQTKRELNNGFVWGAGGRGLVGDRLSRHLVDLYCRNQGGQKLGAGPPGTLNGRVSYSRVLIFARKGG